MINSCGKRKMVEEHACRWYDGEDESGIINHVREEKKL